MASEVLRDLCQREGIQPKQIILHSDNGSPMKGATMLAILQQLGNPIDRHFPLYQRHDHGFEHQGKTAFRSRPRYLYGFDFTVRRLDPWRIAVQIAGVLKEIQMLPLAGYRIVHAT